MEKYTREQLVKLGAEKIRSTPDLFSSFKKFVEEDVCFLYQNCRLPSNCFACTFNNTFSKWSNYVIKNKNLRKEGTIIMANKGNYTLKNEAFKIFFDGKVLSKKSSGEEWLRWIEYPLDKDKVNARKANFETLPTEKKEDEKKVVTRKARTKKVKETEQTENAEGSEEADQKEESKNDTEQDNSPE